MQPPPKTRTTVNGIQSPRRVNQCHPQAKKAFEEELDALSSHSSDPEGPEDPGDTNGKTIEEIRAWCTEYERKQKILRDSGLSANVRELKVYMMLYSCIHALMLCLQPSAQWRHARLLRRPLSASEARDMHRA